MPLSCLLDIIGYGLSQYKSIVVGNFGCDPETRYMPNGDAITNVAEATTEIWKDKNSEQKK